MKTPMTDTKQIKIYQSEDGQIQVNVHLVEETVWLNRLQIAELFGRDVKTVGKHLGNIFKEQELDKFAVIAKFATTAKDGKTYQTERSRNRPPTDKSGIYNELSTQNH